MSVGGRFGKGADTDSTYILRLFVLIATALVAGDAAAQPTNAEPLPQTPARLAIEDDRGAALQALGRAGTLPFPVAVHVAASAGEFDDELSRRLAPLADRKVPIWLSVPAPDRLEDADPWRTSLRRLLDRHGSDLTVFEVVVNAQPPSLAAYAVRLASTELGSLRGVARLALGGSAMADRVRREQIYTADIAPYIDVLSVTEESWEDATGLLARIDPNAKLAITAANVGGQDAKQRLLEIILRAAGTKVSIMAWPTTDRVVEQLKSVSPAAALVTHDVVELDEPGAALKLSIDGNDIGRSISHRLLFDGTSFGTYLAYWGDARDEPLEVSIKLAANGSPIVHELLNGTRTMAAGYVRDEATGDVRIRVPLTGGPMLVDFNENAADVFAERNEVRGQRTLSVAEIIARHQVRQRAQDVLIKNYMAHVRMEQHFRPTIADPGFDVVTENRYFATADDVEWEELSFALNGTKWGADRPPFPLLQPEKVLSPPLQLRFDEGYRYRLAGMERVGDYDCFVIRFEPLRADASLYRGTVWIDRTTFSRIRVQAVQGALAPPVVSNEEIQEYAPPTFVTGQPVFLLNSLKARLIMLIAGRNMLIEKSVTIEDFRINDGQFEEERAAARTSDRVMFRETDRGLRYYVKQNGVRAISERPTLSAKAMALGTTVDPSYGFPLPMFGIEYLDFDFHGPNSQLALLFAGVLATGNIQRPKLWSTPLDASVDFFAIAVPSSDRVYDTGGEKKDERLLTWPLSTGVNLGWQYTPFQKATFQYQFRFDGYVRDSSTVETFAVPSSTVTHGVGFAWEYTRGGYSLALNGTRYHRGNWNTWGPQNGNESSVPDYAKYSANLSRDFYVSAFQKIHLNGAWFGGHDLDRFSKYQFGFFDDTRIHGVPGSGVRFSDLAMARGSYSLNIFEQYRLDVFAEQAWGRDLPDAPIWQPISGFGVAVNMRAPKRTILRADFGKSILPSRYSNVGSTTLQILVLKPMR